MSGKTKGISEEPMQLPEPAVVLSAQEIKIESEIIINEQKQNLCTSNPILSLCQASNPSDLTWMSRIIRVITTGIKISG